MKVAIVGGAPSYKDAPYDDEEFEIWVLGNQINNYEGKRVTRIFEIHDDLTHHKEGYERFLVDLGIPMVVCDKFPIKADHITIFDESKSPLGDYFTSSPAYMIWQAISEGYKDIYIYGVDMAMDNHEYFIQQPCFSAWLGYAKGLGVNVWLPEHCPLLKTRYSERHYKVGEEYHVDEFEQMSKGHAQKVVEIDGEIKDLLIKRASHDGARQAYEKTSKYFRAVRAGQAVRLIDQVIIKE